MSGMSNLATLDYALSTLLARGAMDALEPVPDAFWPLPPEVCDAVVRKFINADVHPSQQVGLSQMQAYGDASGRPLELTRNLLWMLKGLHRDLYEAIAQCRDDSMAPEAEDY